MRYCLFLLGTLFVALKVFSVINWSWWWVLSPYIIIVSWYFLACALIVYILAKYVQMYPEDTKKLNEYLKSKKRI